MVILKQIWNWLFPPKQFPLIHPWQMCEGYECKDRSAIYYMDDTYLCQSCAEEYYG